MPSSCLIMGVLNVTPDSFSDGGAFYQPEDTKKQLQQLIEDGADIIDIGAQSSRPGAKPISANEELTRLQYVFGCVTEYLGGSSATDSKSIKFSIDTDKPEVMLAAIQQGFIFINNINGLFEPKVLSEALSINPNIQYIAMHKHGSFETMQEKPLSTDEGTKQIEEFFVETQQALLRAGFTKKAIWLDPGIGFGKDDPLNLQILQKSTEWSQQFNVVYGVSRKSFIGRILGIENPLKRDVPSKMLECSLMLNGVQMIRTHEVKRLQAIREFIS